MTAVPVNRAKVIDKRIARSISITALVALGIAGNTHAAGITYNIGSVDRESVSRDRDVPVTANSLNITLVFTPKILGTGGIPSGLDLGDFEITCIGCAANATTNFNPCLSSLVAIEGADGLDGQSRGPTTDAAGGEGTGFFGSPSTGGSLQAASGMSQSTIRSAGAPAVVDQAAATTLPDIPNSGCPAWDVKLPGHAEAPVPESATFTLIGYALILLSFVRRKNLLRRH